MFCCNAKLLHAGCFPKGTSQDNIWRINNWGKGFVDYLQIYLRDLLVSSLRFCLWLRICSLRKSSNIFFSYLPQSQSTWWDLQSISCFFVALDQILTWCLTRKLEPLCPAEPLPLCRKSENFFPPNFAQASQALLTEASPGPFSIFHHIFVYILNRGNVFVFTLRHHQKIKKAFQSKQVSGSVKHLVAIQAFFLVKVCFKYLLPFKSWHFATLLVPPNSTTKVSTW